MKQTIEKLSALVSRIESEREEERIYIARVINDELGHTLTALLIDLHSLQKKTEFKNKELNKDLESMINSVNHSIETIRKISSDLSPAILDKLGLGAAIEWQLDEFQKRNGIKCIADIEDRPKEELSKEKVTVIFRIFQEALANISRHAKAKKVQVVLKTENKTIKLFVSDNGQGITKESLNSTKSLGLLAMKERASRVGGEFSISKSIQGGTEISVLIPINN